MVLSAHIFFCVFICYWMTSSKILSLSSICQNIFYRNTYSYFKVVFIFTKVALTLSQCLGVPLERGLDHLVSDTVTGIKNINCTEIASPLCNGLICIYRSNRGVSFKVRLFDNQVRLPVARLNHKTKSNF